MKVILFAALASLTVGAGAVLAQELRDPIEIATEAGVCGDSPVIAAVYADSGSISATCADQPTAFVPVAAPIAALLGVGLLAAAGGDGGTPTTGTNGTN